MRGFILHTLHRYGPHTRAKLQSDCRSVGRRGQFEQPESFDDAISGLLAGGMITSQEVQGETTYFPVYSREKKMEIEESRQAALFE